jgi:hypothetical protein
MRFGPLDHATALTWIGIASVIVALLVMAWLFGG